MAKRASSASTASSSKKSKKDKNDKKQTFFSNPLASKNQQLILSTLRQAHDGRRILLPAKQLYKGKVPAGEEHLLFQYSIDTVNNCGKTATITFDNKCIINGGDQFQNYPNTTNEETTIKDYNIDTFKDDHECFNAHLGRVNKRVNDTKEDAERQREAQIVLGNKDTSDLDEKFNKGASGYELLLAEFKPDGDLLDHTIKSGANYGKVNKKQVWGKCIVYYLPRY